MTRLSDQGAQGDSFWPIPISTLPLERARCIRQRPATALGCQDTRPQSAGLCVEYRSSTAAMVLPFVSSGVPTARYQCRRSNSRQKHLHRVSPSCVSVSLAYDPAPSRSSRPSRDPPSAGTRRIRGLARPTEGGAGDAAERRSIGPMITQRALTLAAPSAQIRHVPRRSRRGVGVQKIRERD